MATKQEGIHGITDEGLLIVAGAKGAISYNCLEEMEKIISGLTPRQTVVVLQRMAQLMTENTLTIAKKMDQINSEWKLDNVKTWKVGSKNPALYTGELVEWNRGLYLAEVDHREGIIIVPSSGEFSEISSGRENRSLEEVQSIREELRMIRKELKRNTFQTPKTPPKERTAMEEFKDSVNHQLWQMGSPTRVVKVVIGGGKAKILVAIHSLYNEKDYKPSRELAIDESKNAINSLYRTKSTLECDIVFLGEEGDYV